MRKKYRSSTFTTLMKQWKKRNYLIFDWSCIFRPWGLYTFSINVFVSRVPTLQRARLEVLSSEPDLTPRLVSHVTFTWHFVSFNEMAGCVSMGLVCQIVLFWRSRNLRYFRTADWKIKGVALPSNCYHGYNGMTDKKYESFDDLISNKII